jgi:uncharacterized damage-inducible protein DinB
MENEQHIYPIGRFLAPEHVTPQMRLEFIARLESFPDRLRKVMAALSPEQLHLSYRKNGWVAQQIIHHLADSHMNAYIRFKLAFTEDTPVIKPYEENAWSELKEVFETPVEVSISLLESLHIRWVNLLRSVPDNFFERAYYHPQYQRNTTMNSALALYAWHADHHLGQIEYILNNNKG